MMLRVWMGCSALHVPFSARRLHAVLNLALPQTHIHTHARARARTQPCPSTLFAQCCCWAVHMQRQLCAYEQAAVHITWSGSCPRRRLLQGLVSRARGPRPPGDASTGVILSHGGLTTTLQRMHQHARPAPAMCGCVWGGAYA